MNAQILREIEGVYIRAIAKHRRRELDRGERHASEVARGLALNDALKSAHKYGLSSEEMRDISAHLSKRISP